MNPTTSHALPAPEDAQAEQLMLESESFQTFDRWMDADLSRLVALWEHAAAPNASRPQPIRRVNRR